MWSPESWTMEAWTQFFQENWLVIVLAIVVILIVIKAVKTVLKWVLVAAIVLGLVAYGGYSIDDLSALRDRIEDSTKDIRTQIEEGTKEAILRAALDEAAKAEYVLEEGGRYVIKTPNLELSGAVGSDEVTIKFRGVPAGTWKIEGPIRTLIEQAQTTAQA